MGIHKACLRVFCIIGSCLLITAGVAEAFAYTPAPPRKPVTVEPSRIYAATDTVPLPVKKPDFSRPDVTELLAFGSTPRPLPKPMPRGREGLSADNAALYRKIFSYQALGQWNKADEAFEKLTDFRLRGHVLYQRFMHPTAYRASFDELIGWMDLYADHPGADKIYKLALARMAADFKGQITRPRNRSTGVNVTMDVLYDKGQDYISPRSRSKAQKEAISALGRAVRTDLRKAAPTRAYKRLMEDERAKLLDPVEYDQIRAQIANSYMLAGNLALARELALASARRSGNKAPMAGWVGGLASWRLDKYKDAASLFELSATSPYASPWEIAAAAYWASRAHTRAGNIRQVSAWLRRAADHPRTFYGLIATRALGWDFDFNWDMPDYTEARAKRLLDTRAGYRAMALVAAGQYHLAETELRQISPGNDETLQEALLAYANHAGLPSYSMRLASAFPHPGGGYYDAALYPLLPWRPQTGFKVDQALIHALIRQESKFNPTVESRSGATGLMQLMPATASFVTGRKQYKTRDGRYNLKDPQVNLDIGQRYVESLMYQDAINFDLFSLAIAYNAGPGNLRRWKEDMSFIRDPLLFVESIPVAETRAFVERVMANYWIYRIRMGQPTPSLDSVTQGDWARYVRMDNIKKASLEGIAPQDADEPASYRLADNR